MTGRRKKQPPPPVPVPAVSLLDVGHLAGRIWAETDRRDGEPQVCDIAAEARHIQKLVVDLLPPARVLRLVITQLGGTCGNSHGADPGHCLQDDEPYSLFLSYSNHRACTVCMLDAVATRLEDQP